MFYNVNLLSEQSVLIYTKETGIIVLSIKTSLRERYKQADLEAIVLKQVHRRARTFLLTFDEHDGINEKIRKGDVIGLERAINCCSPEFDGLIKELKQYSLIEAGRVEVVVGNLVNKGK